FDVSAVTIRNDLALLEQQGLLIRTHGGAMSKPSTSIELAFDFRRGLHPLEKERIGRAAASMVLDGEAIALDASTTAWQVARHLKERRELTVVTNGVFVALEFLDSPGVTVVMPGGSLRPASASLVGDLGASILQRYNVQKGFFGARGFTIAEGLTDVNQYEVELKRHMVGRCKEVIAIVDSSKWGQVAFATFAPLNEIDCVISDERAPQEMLSVLSEKHIKTMLV
ncbi:MAG: DeoR/GlpR transcriptional regulator, partial [Anaerolineae bacterium]|nr:DeoR/GlpR transcriptional regulator [Anaerolineae bacterium]